MYSAEDDVKVDVQRKKEAFSKIYFVSIINEFPSKLKRKKRQTADSRLSKFLSIMLVTNTRRNLKQFKKILPLEKKFTNLIRDNTEQDR